MNFGGIVHLNKRGLFILFCISCLLLLYKFLSRESVQDNLTTKINLHRLLSVAIKAAEKGGREVVAIKDNIQIKIKGKTKEGVNDSLTTADTNSHCVMTEHLKHSFPTLVVISEEEKSSCKTSDYKSEHSEIIGLPDMYVEESDVKVWIDPLDATKEYTEKLYHYVTTMVCVAVNGKPIIGVIHKPFSNETFWAWVGHETSANLRHYENNETGKLRLIMSRSHGGRLKSILNRIFKNKQVDIIEAGGAGYKCLEVARGNAEGYIHITEIKKWDVCAGNAILNALGGQMTTKYNSHITYGSATEVKNEDGLVATLNKNDLSLVDILAS